MLKAWSESCEQSTLQLCEKFEQALYDYEQSGNRLARSYFQALLAELLDRAGETLKAQKTIDIALRESTETGEAFFTAELLRIKGVLACNNSPNNIERAQQQLNKSLAIAKQQHANSLVKRTETSLKQLHTPGSETEKIP